jgi:two-component system sensor histidine kinase/response regulator
VSKPIRQKGLQAYLRIVLRSKATINRVSEGMIRDRLPGPPLAGKGEKGRVLLAEDNLINQKVAVAMLLSAGYRVDVVPSGVEAVAAVAAERYDVILMDCQMPELDGYEATAAIRALRSSGRLTPIIAITAGARQEDRDRCLAEGMDSYLSKPVAKDALLALVARFVKSASAVAALPPSADDESVYEVTLDPAIIDELRNLGTGVELEFLTEIVALFIQDTEPLLTQLGAALDVGDSLTVGRIAHSIRGSGSQVGGRRLASSCGRLMERAVAGSLSDGRVDLLEVELDFRNLCRSLNSHVLSDAQAAAESRG